MACDELATDVVTKPTGCGLSDDQPVLQARNSRSDGTERDALSVSIEQWLGQAATMTDEDDCST